MCCLKYEQSYYEKARKALPRINAEVKTPDGSGKVCELNLLRERVKVKLQLPGDTVDIREYEAKDVKVLKNAGGSKARSAKEDEIVLDEEIKAILD